MDISVSLKYQDLMQATVSMTYPKRWWRCKPLPDCRRPGCLMLRRNRYEVGFSLLSLLYDFLVETPFQFRSWHYYADKTGGVNKSDPLTFPDRISTFVPILVSPGLTYKLFKRLLRASHLVGIRDDSSTRSSNIPAHGQMWWKHCWLYKIFCRPVVKI